MVKELHDFTQHNSSTKMSTYASVILQLFAMDL